MATTVPASLLSDLSRRWLSSAFVQQRIEAHFGHPLPFDEEECDAFAWYMPLATKLAPTHGLPKMPYELVLDLGIDHDGIVPSATIAIKPKKFPHEPCERWNANRKLGVATMRRIVLQAKEKADEFGTFEFVVDEAGHFGFGGIFAEILANQGLISFIWNTSGRGDRVYPFGGDLSSPAAARMGTNPVCFGLPTREYLGFNFIADFATSAISLGAVTRARMLGGALPERTAVDDTGRLTTDPQAAKRLVFDSHRMYCLSLWIEGLAALIGGDLPWHRGRNRPEGKGGGADWVIRVIHPALYETKPGGMARMSKVVAAIAENNGDARVPGERYRGLGGRTSLPADEPISLSPKEFSHLERMSREADFPLTERLARRH